MGTPVRLDEFPTPEDRSGLQRPGSEHGDKDRCGATQSGHASIKAEKEQLGGAHHTAAK